MVSNDLSILTELNIVSTCVRLLIALLCGGLLGLERGIKKRPAGFRTYMLVCVGAALVMMTNEYITKMYPGTDATRMGAQVISGIGFLGAGTIIVTGRNRVKGLTTAAGLWVAACVGLSIGVGYYAGALIGCILTLLVMAALHRLDNSVTADTRVMDLYVEFEQISNIGSFIEYMKGFDIKVSEMEFKQDRSSYEMGIGALFTLHLEKRKSHVELKQLLSQAEGIKYIEEV